MNIVQIIDSKGKRRVGLAAGGQVVLLKKVATTLDLARLALKEGKKLSAMASSLAGSATEDYAAALKEKRVLTPVDHPDPAHCIITGTGLTHLGSAAARDGMHKKLSGAQGRADRQPEDVQDGPRGRQAEVEGRSGRAARMVLQGRRLLAGGARASRCRMPSFALDGGEEPELAGLYLIDDKGKPGAAGLRARQ